VFPPELLAKAHNVLGVLGAAGLKLTTAESCTGGLIAGLLTEIPGSSAVVERGFVTYSNEAKTEVLGIDPELIARHGAVSAQVALAMAEGALCHSAAQISVSVTGVAGPGGGTVLKPIGLVHLAVAQTGRTTVDQTCTFGDIGRQAIRLASVSTALDMVVAAVASRQHGAG
jgi:nicotinamide-nucleotide amidase